VCMTVILLQNKPSNGWFLWGGSLPLNGLHLRVIDYTYIHVHTHTCIVCIDYTYIHVHTHIHKESLRQVIFVQSDLCALLFCKRGLASDHCVYMGQPSVENRVFIENLQ